MSLPGHFRHSVGICGTPVIGMLGTSDGGVVVLVVRVSYVRGGWGATRIHASLLENPPLVLRNTMAICRQFMVSVATGNAHLCYRFRTTALTALLGKAGAGASGVSLGSSGRSGGPVVVVIRVRLGVSVIVVVVGLPGVLIVVVPDRRVLGLTVVVVGLAAGRFRLGLFK